jgi:hypothetical protein
VKKWLGRCLHRGSVKCVSPVRQFKVLHILRTVGLVQMHGRNAELLVLSAAYIGLLRGLNSATDRTLQE